ncbi:MAG: hypothetical protein M1814_006703 [Vezdaea aestivalis]|nr:MAG: hypothetical protein M1814_006703 [Vezdaea aestivalis]
MSTKQLGDGPKSEKELKKLEKLRRFTEKKAQAAAQPARDTAKKVKPAQENKLPPYQEDTPAGQKKILKSLEDDHFKNYNPIAVESAWYAWWEKEGFFQPKFDGDEISKEGSFVMVEPPPNVTGALHIGHALTTALEDIMIRWARMRGMTTLWVPGCDHAGIATQTVVEKMLRRRENKSRHDLGRPAFIERTWQWKEDYHNRINNALRKMGGSFDWTREAFTMDENCSAAVTETFVKLHEEGIIYRGNRLVNWCTELNTALSNLEVDNIELEKRTLLDVPGYTRKVEFGVITHFCYEIEGSTEKIEVATTRPETMLGDSGVAVHPDDKRYKHLVGKHAKHPFVNRLMPIFADTYVDPEFGTGAVKITPAHDPNDFNLGKAHNLEFINILNDNGTLNDNAGTFAGQRRFDARYTVEQALKDKGLFVKKDDNPMKVPICSRSKDVIEPLMKPQWWMRMDTLAKPALDAVKNGDIKVRPETAEKNYISWLSNMHDWCLSRQLWWGHQCPIYMVEFEGETADGSKDESWISGRTLEEAEKKADAKYPGKRYTLTRDEDVLDTWFSSALWPFSTLGWPQKTHDFEKLYPTTVLETGWDIIAFWVAKMVILGLKMTGQVPFKEVYCHGLIRDSDGRKMSKSLGNVIDPLDVISGIPLQVLHDKLKEGNLDPKEVDRAIKFQKQSFPQGIPECGSDALRFSLAGYTTGGTDINLSVNVIHSNRKFCNKIYQATKFALKWLGDDFAPHQQAQRSGNESLAERWILHKYAIASKEMNEAINDRDFSRATQIIYSFLYSDLFDVFIENSKAIFTDGNAQDQLSARETLYTVHAGGLALMHPFMPFLTEELWQRLPRRKGESTPSICVTAYPRYDEALEDKAAEKDYDLVLGASKSIRSIIGERKVKGEYEVTIQALEDSALGPLKSNQEAIKSLSPKGVAKMNLIGPGEAVPQSSAYGPVSLSAAVFLHLADLKDPEPEISKASARLSQAKDGAATQKKMIEDPEYQKKAQSGQEFEVRKLAGLEEEVRQWEGMISRMKSLKV